MEIYFMDVCLACLAVYVVGSLLQKRRAPLPPGPPGWPLIGNLLDFPAHAPYKTFRAMSQKYGPIISLNVLGKKYVVLNTLEACKEILEKRSAITPNKQHYTMGGDLVGWSNSTGFLQSGDVHRKHRKYLHQQIGTKSNLEVFYPSQEKEAMEFLRNVLKSPDKLIAHSRRAAGAISLKISHGYSVEGDDDPFVEMADKSMQIFYRVLAPGHFLVDKFPILRHLPEWFPGGGFHRDAKQWWKIVRETADVPHQFVLERLAKGDASPSLTSRLLQEGVTPEEEEILKWVSFSMYTGGSDTTSITLSSFFLAMTVYPEIFKKGKAEVDAVVGNERLPTMQDCGALPYVNAICTELFRWCVLSTLVLHVSTQDIAYKGYLIPKGTAFLGNIWAILSGHEMYPDPDVFDPERFLGENKQTDPREACFGWGRRIYPGALLAESTVFICVAMSLATLDISRCIKDGVVLVPKHETEEGVIRRIKPFKCEVTARSKRAEELLHT